MAGLCSTDQVIISQIISVLNSEGIIDEVNNSIKFFEAFACNDVHYGWILQLHTPIHLVTRHVEANVHFLYISDDTGSGLDIVQVC